MSKEEYDAIIEASEAHEAKMAALMPDTESAVQMLYNAYERLKAFGWRPMMYAPKGDVAETICVGSTGIFAAQWLGNGWFVEDGGDLWPDDPILYRPSKEELDAMSARMRAAVLSVYGPDGEPS